MNCAFCGQPAAHVCGWPIKQKIMISAGKVEPGDRMVIDDGLQPVDKTQSSIVQRVERDNGSFGPTLIFCENRQGDVTRRIRQPGMTVLVLRPGPCGAPCCDNCAREVDDNRAYCAEHWNAWEKVA